MSEFIAKSVAFALYAYVLLGLLFGVAFIDRGIQRLDHEAQGAGWGFRMIVLPGTVLLWPLLLHRWIAGISEPPTQKDPHR